MVIKSIFVVLEIFFLVSPFCTVYYYIKVSNVYVVSHLFYVAL